MGYAVIRHQFINEQKSFARRIKHNTRDFSSVKKHINPERTKDNIRLVEPKTTNSKELLKEIKTIMDGVRKEELAKGTQSTKIKRNLKAGADYAFESLIIANDKTMKEETKVLFLKKAFVEFKEKYKGHEIIQADIHLDESNPHLHLVACLFSTEKKKWCKRELFGFDYKSEEKSYSRSQDWIAKVGREFNLERGLDKEIKKKKYSKNVLHPEEHAEIIKEVTKSYTKVADTDPELQAGYAKSRSMKIETLAKNYQLTPKDILEAKEIKKAEYFLNDDAIVELRYELEEKERIKAKKQLEDFYSKLIKDLMTAHTDKQTDKTRDEIQRMRAEKEKALKDFEKKSSSHDFI